MKFKMASLPIVSLLVLGSVLFSCQDEKIDRNNSVEEFPKVDLSNSVEGLIRIKISETKASQLSVSLKSGIVQSNVTKLDSVLNSIGATSFKRTFPYAGKFEKRSVDRGLNLWYDITYDTTEVKLPEVISKMEILSEVEYTESIRKINRNHIKIKPLQARLKSVSETTYPFNDEYLPDQWHYSNDGTFTDAVVGSDINLFNAWEIQTGSSEVIVAVVDGGIDYSHEDLAANMWINTQEANGGANADDDSNGYTDDVYGYNFVEGTGAIAPDPHGTHVAGTIGAVNNNGLGVCGIAGGDQMHAGVRLMSCQVFGSDTNGDDTSAQDFAEAIKYAADNGAVICQNSWGYDGASSLPQSEKEAIDYFIANAGIDENGSQTGPMKGGIVIFAAGNDAKTIDAYPAMYDAVVAVAASSADYTIASYSNYGSWVDITAPGGDETDDVLYDNWILSTIEGGYAYMVGTSMACPHVSGVAALVISQYGEMGFTPEMLKFHLYQGAVDLDSYNPGFSGLYGVGLIDAAAALANSDGEPPLAVSDLKGSVSSNQASLAWTVTADAEGNEAYAYNIYYSTSPISESVVNNHDSNVQVVSVRVGALNSGDELTTTIDGLQYSTSYYFVVAGYTVGGAFGEISNSVILATESNHQPILNAVDGTVFSLLSHESKTVDVTIEDPDGDTYTWSYSDPSGGSSATESSEGVTLTINALWVSEGAYTSTLTVQDAYGATSTMDLSYTVAANSSPAISDLMENIYIGSKSSSATLDLANYFNDADGEILNYNISYDDSKLNVSVRNRNLSIIPRTLGLSAVEIIAYDARGAQISQTFSVMVREDSNAIDVYPNPVTDVVNFRLGNNVDGDMEVEVYNTNGILLKQIKTSISTFAPARIDLSDLSSGKYLLVVKYGKSEYKENIVKL